MRIIAGQSGSIPLLVPRSLTRPTTDRVREALFAALGDLIPGARVLDLFAGSGSLGIESLSRGASSADFVESDSDACRIIGKNLAKTRLSPGKVFHRDVMAFLTTLRPESYDLIFADPPYGRDESSRDRITKLLRAPSLAQALAPDGIFLLETLASEPFPENHLWNENESRIYGATRISFLKPLR